MKRILLSGVALALAWPAAAQHAHEHGLAELQVAVEGKRLLIELRSPLDNLVGFEHAPKDDAQRKALAGAEERLRGFDELFLLPAQAQCELRTVDLDSPYPQDAKGGSAESHAHADDHGHDDAHEEGHKEGHGHDGHADADEHGHGEGHAEMHVCYELECADPAALEHMDVRLIDAFPRMQRIGAVTATERGQGAATLDKSRRALPL